uniref:Putative inactive protein RESTRICTED TEV MOVEMENT 1-like n=1 Tax=Davidia involucrata TaxID=16924 RepID=A0A5B7CAJ3_DAVIN
MIKIGTSSGGGEVWDDKDRSDIVQIFISWTEGTKRLNFIQFLYVENGTLVLSEKRGGMPGNKFKTVKFDYPSEFLTRLSCRGYTSYCGLNYVSSITFGTNRGTYGPFGQAKESDTFYDFDMGQDRPFGGFYGTTRDGRLESIGVYVRPIATLNNTTTEVEQEEEEEEEDNSHYSD